MYLESNNFKFPVQIIDEEWDDEVAIYVGQHRKTPCIIILIEKGKKVARMQSVSFFDHCSVSTENKFTRRSGAVVLMVKVVLQWLVHTYNITTVVFADESHSEQGYMLPEKMMLTEGQTWYQKHLGAEPEATRTKPIVKAFTKLYTQHKEHFKSLNCSAWLVDNLREVLKPYNNIIQHQQLTSSVWNITSKTIQNYNTVYTEHPETLGGSWKKQLQKRCMTPQLFKHIVE